MATKPGEDDDEYVPGDPDPRHMPELPDFGLFEAINRFASGSVVVIILVALVLFGGYLVVFAYAADENSFNQLMAIEIASGIGIYLSGLTILALGRRHLWAVRSCLLVASAVCAYEAFQAHGVNRHLLIEACSGFLLMVGLELTVTRVIEWMKEWART